MAEQLRFFFDLFDLNGDALLQVNIVFANRSPFQADELIVFIEALHEQQRLDGLKPQLLPQTLVSVLLLEADEVFYKSFFFCKEFRMAMVA